MNELTNKSNQLILFIFLLFSWLFGVWILGGTIYPNKPNVSTPFHVVLIGPKPPDFSWLTCRGPARHNFTPSHYDKEKISTPSPNFRLTVINLEQVNFLFFFFLAISQIWWIIYYIRERGVYLVDCCLMGDSNNSKPSNPAQRTNQDGRNNNKVAKLIIKWNYYKKNLAAHNTRSKAESRKSFFSSCLCFLIICNYSQVKSGHQMTSNSCSVLTNRLIRHCSVTSWCLRPRK